MKLAIVHDQPAALAALARAAADDDGVEVAWTAADTASAIARAARACPDALLIAVGMVGGLELLAALRATRCPVVVVADDSDAARGQTFALMSAGAVDVVVLPALATGVIDRAALQRKLHLLRRLTTRSSPSWPAVREPSMAGSARPPVIALGASTGGPQALAAVLSRLPRELPATIVIVQHIDPEFGPSLATWLGQVTGVTVELARAGVQPVAGTAYVAATGEHLIVGDRGALAYVSEPSQLAHRPSIDVLFRSLRTSPRPGVAALLTGMGKDGALGLGELRRAGWPTIAQDEASSVVYGMPKAAVEQGAASQVLALDRIGAAIGLLLAAAR